jgi:hypothetical protein
MKNHTKLSFAIIIAGCCCALALFTAASPPSIAADMSFQNLISVEATSNISPYTMVSRWKEFVKANPSYPRSLEILNHTCILSMNARSEEAATAIRTRAILDQTAPGNQ